jgi:predicted AlkP superfamily phosphohydrolase/phosphomutase
MLTEVIIGLVGTVFGSLITFLTKRSRSLDSQRADFEAVLTPVLAELKDLRDRVKTLESQHVVDTQQHYADQRRIDVLIDYVKDLLAFIRLHVPSPEPPPIPTEISNDI